MAAGRSREFVGIAEGIKSHELSVKDAIENLKKSIENHKSSRRRLKGEISNLEAQIAAAYEDTDEDGSPDYGRIAQLEQQKEACRAQLSGVESSLKEDNTALESSQNELAEVTEEKQQTLYEIQQRASQTAANISVAGGMYGAYAGIGAGLQSSMQSSLAALSQAASILGGSVSSGGGGGGGRGGSGGGGGSAGGSGISGALGGTLAGIRAANALTGGGGGGSTTPHSAARYASGQGGMTTPGSRNSFSGGHKSNSSVAADARNFTSSQSGNDRAAASFGGREQDGNGTKAAAPAGVSAVMYQSKQNSSDLAARFSKGKGGNPPENGGGGTGHGSYADYRAHSDKYRYEAAEKPRFVSVDAQAIMDIRGADDPGFWSYKGRSMDDFVEMARKIPYVEEQLRSGRTVESIRKEGGVTAACLEQYYLKRDITVIQVGDKCILGDAGRHRVMAAAMAHVNIPVMMEGAMVTDGGAANIPVGQTHPKHTAFQDRLRSQYRTTEQILSGGSREELRNLALNEQLAAHVDFGNLDDETSRMMVRTILDCKRDYPFVHMEYLGSEQAVYGTLEAGFRKELTNVLERNHPQWKGTDIIKDFVDDRTGWFMNEYLQAGNDEWRAASLQVDRPEKRTYPEKWEELSDDNLNYMAEGLAGQRTGIIFNESAIQSYRHLSEDLAAHVKEGWHPQGCEKPEYLACHEFGHELDKVLKISEDPRVVQIYDAFMAKNPDIQKSSLCEYAKENIREFVAEAWAEYRVNPHPRKVAQRIGQIVDELAAGYRGNLSSGGGFEREREYPY